MKDTYFLYCVAILAIVGVFVCFIGYAKYTHKEVPVVTTTVKKKDCVCCEEKNGEIVKTIRQNREKMIVYKKRYTQATDIITQYGLKEGLRKLKQSDPEIAAQFERFLVEHPAGRKNDRSSP